MERQLFRVFVVIFCVDCTIRGDTDAVKQLFKALGIENKELAELNEKELISVVSGAAEKYQTTIDDAEFFKFILHVRVRAEEAENFYVNLKGINVENDQVYKQCLKRIFNKTDPPELGKGVHFRKWIVTLHEGDETISSSLHYLRQSLDYDRKQYFKFATGMQRIYDIFSKPQHPNVLKVRYFNASDPEKYIRFLNADCKFSVRKFLKSEMIDEELGNESEDEGTSEE